MVSSTIKSSGGTYPDVDTWEANSVDGDSITGSCESSADLLTADTTINIPNTGGYTYLLTADAANQVSTPTYANLTSKARLVSTSSNCLVISTTGVVIEKIGFLASSGGQCISINNAMTLRRCI